MKTTDPKIARETLREAVCVFSCGSTLAVRYGNMDTIHYNIIDNDDIENVLKNVLEDYAKKNMGIIYRDAEVYILNIKVNYISNVITDECVARIHDRGEGMGFCDVEIEDNEDNPGVSVYPEAFFIDLVAGEIYINQQP